jgi:hypothetical protein
MIATVIVSQCLTKDAILDYLHQHASAVHSMTISDLQEAHRKRITILKNNHNQDMRETRDEIHRLHAKFNRLNNEHDWICTAYQDQMRSNEEQQGRIVYLEKTLKEFGQLAGSSDQAPFSAPASQITFVNPSCRVHSVVKVSSPLSQTPMVQVQDAEEE